MNRTIKILLAAVGLLISHSSSAGVFNFSYVFDASGSGTAGHVLAGTVNGNLQGDGDTIFIDSFISASLNGFAYDISGDTAIRAANPFDQATMSLSGNTLDFWVCTQGFTQTNANYGGGDCPFGNEGGFLISYDVEFGAAFGTDNGGRAHAGIPDISVLNAFGNNVYRDSDNPINASNWTASEVPEPAPMLLLSFGLLGLLVSTKRKV